MVINRSFPQSPGRRVVSIAAVVVVAPFLKGQIPPCAGAYTVTTNDYFFSASAAEGAVGDVVPVELRVTFDRVPQDLVAFSIYGCYDRELLELLPM
jgi:hypothetical protein